MKWLLCYLPLILLIAGCSDNNKGTNPTENKQIWPLKAGNEWILEGRMLDSAGNTRRVDTSVLAVVKDTLIEGERWYITAWDGVRDPEGYLGTNRSDGCWAGNSTGFALQFKYPAAVGDTFTWGDKATRVESLSDTVTVPAGTFVCLNYKWVGGSVSNRVYQYIYLSPGVGVVKVEEFYKTAGEYIYMGIRMELLSYTLK